MADRTARGQQEIRGLKDAFVEAFVKTDSGRRASIWADDGELVPPQGASFRGGRPSRGISRLRCRA